MAWIESHQSLQKHRKTTRAALLLKCDRYKLMGHLHALWYWGLDNADKDGWISDALDEELAEAAGWPERRAKAFVDALVEVRFLERAGNGYIFHHWALYTWRYYQGQERSEEASVSGSFGNHVRWHVDRGVVAAECAHCIAKPSLPESGGDTSAIRVSESGGESGANRSQPHSTQPNNQPTEPPDPDPEALAKKNGHKTPLRDHALNFSDAEWLALREQFPRQNIQKRWREWVDWIEEGGGESGPRWPKDKFAAFIGFMKRRNLRPVAAASS